MSTGAAPLATPESAPLSQMGRVVNTFIAPSKTFTDIRRSAGWWLPWLLLSVISLGLVYTIDKKIGWQQVVETMVSRSARAQTQMEQLSPEQRQRAIDLQAKIYRYAAYAAPVTALLYLVIIAAVLLAAFNFGAGAEVKFSTALAIVAYSALPGLIHGAVGIVSLLAGVNPEGFNLQNPVASNFAYFMDPSQNKFLYGMVSGLDVFVIWTIVLLAMGFTANSKVKRGTAFGISIALFLVYKIAASAVGTLG